MTTNHQIAEPSVKYLAEAAGQAVPAGYKLTEVGVIPEDWEAKELGELVTISSGESPSKFQFLSEGLPYFKVEQLNNGSVYAEETPYFINSSKNVPAGSVIFPKRGASILSNKIRILKSDSFMDTNLMTLTCSKSLSELYLYNQLSYRGLDSVADTTSIPQINNKHIIPYRIPYPNFEEQTAIANALSDVDALINELEKLIAKKQAIKTATMQQLLTGRTRLPPFALREDGTPKGYKPSELGEIPEDWDVLRLPKVIWYQEGPGLRNWQFKKKGLKVINVTNLQENGWLDLDRTDRHISWDEFEKTYKHFLCDEGDLVIASSGNSYCKYSVVRGCDLPLLMNTSVIRFKPINDFSKIFMNVYLKSQYFKDQIDLLITGGAQPNFGPAHLDRIQILTPLQAEEQTAIATILSDMDTEIQALQQRLAKTRHIKQGMMQELLTGKTRLVKTSAELVGKR
jgi:type I restriction enzyme S subunit